MMPTTSATKLSQAAGPLLSHTNYRKLNGGLRCARGIVMQTKKNNSLSNFLMQI